MAQWREVTMKEAIRFIRDECGQPIDTIPQYSPENYPPGCSMAGVEWFDNGTAVACESQWCYSYGEEVGDSIIDPVSPKWWIYC